jgi:hypothetical protein
MHPDISVAASNVRVVAAADIGAREKIGLFTFGSMPRRQAVPVDFESIWLLTQDFRKRARSIGKRIDKPHDPLKCALRAPRYAAMNDW